MEISCQKFGLDLLKTLCKEDFSKNVIYSPMSIYMALGMTLYGAKGDTSGEMMKTLHWDQLNSESFHQQLSDCIKTSNVDEKDQGTIRVANKLFLENKYELLDSYVKAVDKFYNGGIEKMDFQSNPDKSCRDINCWVENQTNGKIKDLLQPNNINSLTRLILVNAIYFKNSWKNEFSVVGDKTFHLLNGSSIPTTMISKTETYKYLKNPTLGFAAVQIPFKRIHNDDYSFMVVLPLERCSLPKFETVLFQQEWKTVFGDSLFEFVGVHVTMPKFRIESSFKLKEELMHLGMVKPFTDAADFSSMTSKPELMIDDVVHKAFIDVTEHGVEAAAATAVMMMLRCAPMRPIDPIEFNCDHPFMFAVVKQGSLPLFIGHCAQC